MQQLANGVLAVALQQKHERIIRGRINEVALLPVKLVSCEQGILSRMGGVKPRQLVEGGPAVPLRCRERGNSFSKPKGNFLFGPVLGTRGELIHHGMSQLVKKQLVHLGLCRRHKSPAMGRLDQHLVVTRPRPQPGVVGSAGGAFELLVVAKHVDVHDFPELTPALQPGNRLANGLYQHLRIRAV
jgi:hypothetical protein